MDNLLNLDGIPAPIARGLEVIAEMARIGTCRHQDEELQLFAVVQANNVTRICTYNAKEFLDYDRIEVVSP